VVSVKVCSETGKLATEFCPETFYATYDQEGAPGIACDLHKTPLDFLMPNLVGLPVEEARASLEQSGVHFEVFETDDPGIPAGQVASQDPAAGAKVDQEAAVKIFVSRGPQVTGEIEVPNVLGLNKDQGWATMKDAGLNISFVWVPVNNPRQVNIIVGQLPPAGTLVKPDVEVILRVGKAASRPD
jgi:serine/threonine-protein kinase